MCNHTPDVVDPRDESRADGADAAKAAAVVGTHVRGRS